jgi:hypothetical protein
MTGETDKIRDAFADQLTSFDQRLSSTPGDPQLLSDIREGIASLLLSAEDSEAKIRGVLQERYDSGDLSKATFQLVTTMLDRCVTERLLTSPDEEHYNITAPSAARPPDIDTCSSTRFPAAAWASSTRRSIDVSPKRVPIRAVLL